MNSKSVWESRFFPALTLLLLCLAAHAVVAVFLYQGRPEYFAIPSLQVNPDAQHYMLLADNLWNGHGFSRMDAPPYQPDALRTPLFPAVCAILWGVFHSMWAVFLFNALCHGITSILVYRLGRLLLRPAFAMAAGLLFVWNAVLISQSFESMSESLFILLATAGSYAFIATLHEAKSGGFSRGKLLLSGTLIGLCILTRPTGLYLPVVLIFAAGGAWAMRPQLKLPWLRLGWLILPVFIAVFPWLLRNQVTFGLFRLSTVDAINMVYYAGAGPIEWRQGISLDRAQEQISREYRLASNLDYHNPWQTSQSIKQLDDAIRSQSKRILFHDPAALVASSLIGICKSFLGHSANVLIEMTGQTWQSPGMGNLLRGHLGEFGRQAAKNPGWVVAAFAIQTLQGFLFLPFFLLGLALMLWRLRRDIQAWPYLGLTAYYLLTIALGGMDATARFKTVLLPLGHVLAVYAVMTLWDKFRRRNQGLNQGISRPLPSTT